MTRHLVDGTSSRRPDDVIVEEPLEIRLDDHLVATTMRTPGDDFELAVGFCHTEGLLGDAAVTDIRYCALGPAAESEFNVVSVDTRGAAVVPTPRLGNTTSSCGVCGSASIEELAARLEPLAPVDVDTAVLGAVGRTVAGRQGLFDRTGGVHAAATFELATGEIGLLREDIGRHNAVDKLVGRLRLDGRLPASSHGLWISGRASYEMVQKAWAAGIGAVVSVSAASALAVQTARRANIVLAGFARDERLVIYE
jgi:FdhD protein